MSQSGRQSLNTSNVLCVIMGGGQGTRLFPLTKERAKPAVPLAGKYRFVDFCRNLKSGFRFEAALHSAYTRFDNTKDLEKAWLKYLEDEK